ncbi:uncharacterized protein LOC100209689 [Hydra vulgaris]|uniref:Uncharacterized protein LOC100209689 n=1 Tax=Hydra vulgaris TaxID=6087 RepID=A0ABM4BDJ0_HYDVU
MGRPISNRRSDSSVEGKIYDSSCCDKKKDKKRFYKSEFQKQIGNSKTGQGFAALQKRKILKKFNRSFKKKTTNQLASPVAIKPLSNIKDSFLQPLSNIEDSLLQDTLTNSSANETIKTEIFSSDSLSSADAPKILSKKKKTEQSKIKSSYQRIEIDYEKVHEERRKKSEEIRANIKKHEQAVAKSLEKRKKLAKRLNKKTSRGQPVMATRMELLYEKISKR